MYSRARLLFDRNLFITEDSKGRVVSVFVSVDEVLLLPVTSLSNPFGVTMFMSSFRWLSTDMC